MKLPIASYIRSMGVIAGLVDHAKKELDLAGLFDKDSDYDGMIGKAAQGKEELKLGHPSGIFDVEAKVEKQGDAYVLKEAAYGRTARRLMEGHVLVPDRSFK